MVTAQFVRTGITFPSKKVATESFFFRVFGELLQLSAKAV
jgi:hypothetical protein